MLHRAAAIVGEEQVVPTAARHRADHPALRTNGEAPERLTAVRPTLRPAVHHPAAALTTVAAAVHLAAPTAEEVLPVAEAVVRDPAAEAAGRAAVDDVNKKENENHLLHHPWNGLCGGGFVI